MLSLENEVENGFLRIRIANVSNIYKSKAERLSYKKMAGHHWRRTQLLFHDDGPREKRGC